MYPMGLYICHIVCYIFGSSKYSRFSTSHYAVLRHKYDRLHTVSNKQQYFKNEMRYRRVVYISNKYLTSLKLEGIF